MDKDECCSVLLKGLISCSFFLGFLEQGFLLAGFLCLFLSFLLKGTFSYPLIFIVFCQLLHWNKFSLFLLTMHILDCNGPIKNSQIVLTECISLGLKTNRNTAYVMWESSSSHSIIRRTCGCHLKVKFNELNISRF